MATTFAQSSDNIKYSVSQTLDLVNNLRPSMVREGTYDDSWKKSVMGLEIVSNKSEIDELRNDVNQLKQEHGLTLDSTGTIVVYPNSLSKADFSRIAFNSRHSQISTVPISYTPIRMIFSKLVDLQTVMMDGYICKTDPSTHAPTNTLFWVGLQKTSPLRIMLPANKTITSAVINFKWWPAGDGDRLFVRAIRGVPSNSGFDENTIWNYSSEVQSIPYVLNTSESDIIPSVTQQITLTGFKKLSTGGPNVIEITSSTTGGSRSRIRLESVIINYNQE